MGKFLTQLNNAQTVGISGGKEVKNMSHIDDSILESLDMKKTDNHLGLLNMFEMTGMVTVPLIRDILKSKDVIYVNGRKGSFTYDVDMGMEYPTVVQSIDTSEEFLGIDGTPFTIKLSHAYTAGDVLTYDPHEGLQVIVSEDVPVRFEGDGYVHTVTINNRNREAYFPKYKLEAGTRFYKVNHSVGEYGTQYSNISGAGTPKKVKMEYQIGAMKGVEVSYTDWANSATLNGTNAGWITDALYNKAIALAGDDKNIEDKYLVLQTKTKKGVVQKVEQLLPMLAIAELYKINAAGLMFSHGSIQTGLNGAKRVSEGIYPQLRRGHRLTYRNEMELRAMYKQAADIIYSGVASHIPVGKRKLKFKVGKRAYDLTIDMFRDEFEKGYAPALEANGIPVPLLTGKDRHNLAFESFTITKAMLRGIGFVEVEHDISLDYDFGEIVLRGYSGGYNKRSWSAIVYDISEATNVMDKSLLPDGVTVEDGSKGKNLYLIKPENKPDLVWNWELGRGSSQSRFVSTSRQGDTFSCSTQMDAWIPDLSRTILIEHVDAYTEDFFRF